MQPDVMQHLFTWMAERSDFIMLVILTLAVVYVIWYDGYERGKRTGYEDGFINGIMHEIQARVIPNTNDSFIVAAQQRLMEQRDRNRPDNQE